MKSEILVSNWSERESIMWSLAAHPRMQSQARDLICSHSENSTSHLFVWYAISIYSSKSTIELLASNWCV